MIVQFPELTDRALELYMDSYGQKMYDNYRSKFNGSKPFRKAFGQMRFEHRPHHDVESFIWITIESLVKAWPEDGKECLTKNAITVMRGFDGHDIDDETRFSIEQLPLLGWTNALHPKLSGLAPMLRELSIFLQTDWRLWEGELKEDFLHEVLKRILLQEIVRIEDDKADVLLREEQRTIPIELPKDDSPNNKNVNGKRVSSYVSDSDSSDLVIKRGRLF